MAKIFSFASWNVKHFSGRADRVDRVTDLLGQKNPDVFALFEVRGKDVFTPLMEKMPDHSFTITENTVQNDMEILVGVRKGMQHFITQREEFQSKTPTLRPGALATLRISGEMYSALFLHVKSFPDPRAWGLRDDMFKRAAGLKRKLDGNLAPGTPNMLCLGDLNTMGLNAPYNDVSDLTAAQELEFLTHRMNAVRMRRLQKSHDQTWWNGRDNTAPSDLDHAFASDHLNVVAPGGAEIETVGWPEKPSADERRDWIDQFSDHALLYGEVHD